jgi:hypothetical protein
MVRKQTTFVVLVIVLLKQLDEILLALAEVIEAIARAL